MSRRDAAEHSLQDLPNDVVDIVLHHAFQKLGRHQRGQLRLTCKRWASQILHEVEDDGFSITQSFDLPQAVFLLRQLPKLKALTCSARICSLEPLLSLTSLTSLSLSLHKPKDVFPLRELQKLQRLEVLESSLEREQLLGLPGWDSLASLPALRYISLQDPGASECTWLAACRQITEMKISWFHRPDLLSLSPGLCRMPGLHKLTTTHLKDGWQMSELKSLQALCIKPKLFYLFSLPDVQLTPLLALTALHTLCVEGSWIREDISLLASLTQLTCLGVRSSYPIWGESASDRTWLSRLHQLQYLDLEDSGMEDDCSSALTFLTSLRRLNIRQNKRLSCVAPLGVLPQLTWLGLGRNDIHLGLCVRCLPARVTLSRSDEKLQWFQNA